MFYRRPRVFLSYRHQYYAQGPHAEHDAAHQAWVASFASDLASQNVDVIYDVRLRRLFEPYVADPRNAPFLGEVSILCLFAAHIFTPIITWGYVKRLRLEGAGTFLGDDFTEAGTVTEEWENACPLIDAGKLQLMLVQRQWAPGIEEFHPHLNAKLRFDFRERGIPYRDKIEILATYMHLEVEVGRPFVDLPFSEWISLYVNWCAKHDPACVGQRMDDWGCDFARSRRFLAYVEELRTKGALPSAEEGSGRHDKDHLLETPPPDRLVLDI